MIILAIDLTSSFGSLAIRANGVNVGETALESSDGFAHLVFPAIETLLSGARLKLADIDCFASASGPGAFTGVRVGLSAIKGLAEALRRPVSGVSNLRALSTFGTARRRAVLLDARRGDIFAAMYDEQSEPLTGELVSKLDAWLAGLPLQPDEFILQDSDLLKGRGLPVVEAPKRLAAAIALCAEIDGKQNRWLDSAALDANYVRRSDAELFWREN